MNFILFIHGGSNRWETAIAENWNPHGRNEQLLLSCHAFYIISTLIRGVNQSVFYSTANCISSSFKLSFLVALQGTAGHSNYLMSFSFMPFRPGRDPFWLRLWLIWRGTLADFQVLWDISTPKKKKKEYLKHAKTHRSFWKITIAVLNCIHEWQTHYQQKIIQGLYSYILIYIYIKNSKIPFGCLWIFLKQELENL